MENEELVNTASGEIEWGGEISEDGSENIILTEGDYNFEVTNFERGRFPGGAKLTPCNKATLTVRVDTEDGSAFVKFDLLLHRSVEWKLSAFFRSIGQKKSGEKLVMDWNKVPFAKGRAHFKPRSYVDKNGETKEVNDVAYFIDYDEKFFQDDLPF